MRCYILPKIKIFFTVIKATFVRFFLRYVWVYIFVFLRYTIAKILRNWASLQLCKLLSSISCYFEPRNLAVANALVGTFNKKLYTKIRITLKLQLCIHTGTPMFTQIYMMYLRIPFLCKEFKKINGVWKIFQI